MCCTVEVANNDDAKKVASSLCQFGRNVAVSIAFSDGEPCGERSAEPAHHYRPVPTLDTRFLCTITSPVSKASKALTKEGYQALLYAALTTPRNVGWLQDAAYHLPEAVLVANSIPKALAGKGAGIVHHLRCKRDTELLAHSHGTLVLLGPRNVGKTTLLWRLHHPDAPHKPEPAPTRGMVTGMPQPKMCGFCIATDSCTYPLQVHCV